MATDGTGAAVLRAEEPNLSQLADLLQVLRDAGRKVGGADGTALARKAGALELLLHEVKRRASTTGTARFPASAWEPAAVGTPLEPAQGQTCADAPAVAEGQFTKVMSRHTGGADPALWLRYTPAKSGVAVVSSAGSDFDTRIEVYRGCPAADAAPIARADDEVGLQARASFRAAAGETFWIRVGGADGASGGAAVQLESGQAGIQGTVIDEATGQAPTWGQVKVWNGIGLVASGDVDAEGAYLVGVSPGTYFASTSVDSWDGLRDELYDDLPCAGGAPQGCSPAMGTAIAVQDGTLVDGIDFTLGHGAAIAGRVRDAVTGEPLGNATVEVFGSNGQRIRYAITDDVGRFLATGLPSGVVYAVAAASWGYRRELYENIACVPGCNATTGTPISLADGQTTPGIDFALEHLGAISGTVTRLTNGAPVGFAHITVRDAQGFERSSTYADASGEYLAGGLEAGSYFVTTQTWGAYADELYDDLPCEPTCDTSAGTPVPVTLGNTTPGIDFVLRRMATISGDLTDAVSGDPIQTYFGDAVSISVFDAAGMLVGSAYSYGAEYEVTGLAAGTYYVKASHHFYRAEVYDDVPCPGAGACDPTTGAPVTVALDGGAGGIDFALTPLGSISGRVVSAATNAAIAVPVQVWSSSGQPVQGATSFDGEYEIRGLPDGNYFVTAGSDEFATELYDDIPCPGGPPAGCVPTSGSSVSVGLGVTTSGIDFALTPKGRITGTVRDASTALPIDAAQIWVYNASGVLAALSYCDGNGKYEVGGLDAGSYFVVADSQSENHDAEVYDDVSCPNAACNPTIGTPVPVTVGSTAAGIDFALSPSGGFAGTVTRPDGGSETFAHLYLYDAGGNLAGYTSTDSQGRYQMPAEPGTWFVLADPSTALMSQLYSGIPCPGNACNVTTGTPIVVVRGAVTPGIDFTLSYAQGIVGRVLDSGHPLAGIAIDLWNAAGQHVDKDVTAPTGSYHLEPPGPGTYFVSTDNGIGALDEVWNDVPCPLGPAYKGLCDPTTGTPIAVAGSQALVSGIDFSLDNVRLFANGFEPGERAWAASRP